MRDRYSQSEEDYLETIYLIGLENKAVRVKDVAQEAGVTMPSVVAAIKSLSEKGLVEQERYGAIKLTPAGKEVAKDVYARHKVLFTFFHEVLGLDPEIAEKDACQAEHHLSAETEERLAKIVEYVQTCCNEQEQAIFLKRFMHFVRTGDRPKPCCGCQE